MRDERTLAFINFYGILGALSELCARVPKAKKLLANKKATIEISVKNGPVGRLAFENGECRVLPGPGKCDIRLPFSSPKKFNGMIDGTVTPIPSKGFTKIGFLLKTFVPLTDILTKYLRPSDEDMKDEEFYRTSTILTFYVVTEAISQLACNDKVSMSSASYIVDGTVRVSIADVISASIIAKDHVLVTKHESPSEYLSSMEFADINVACDLFAGRINSVAAVGLGKVRICGMISQVDNVNRILDRVSLYLS